MKKLTVLFTSMVIASASFADTATINVNQKPMPNPVANVSSSSTQAFAAQAGYTPPPSINVNAAAWVLMSYQTGKILSEKNMQVIRKPASLVKIMTAYVVAQALQNKSISWDEQVPVTNKAWKTGGSKMFIKPGQKVTVGELMQGMIVQSGNDATVALSEFVAGSEGAFVGMMNQTAQQLGMKNTHFENANGLPAKGQDTTAFDIALLARAFIHNFPEYYKIYSQKSFTWNGITQSNRNTLLQTNPLVDGMKTGHTRAAGYNLVTSAHKDGQRVISVVLGTPSAQVRTDDSNKLITYGFRFFNTVPLYKEGEVIKTLKVAKAETLDQTVGLYITQPIILTVPKGAKDYIHKDIKLKSELAAPLSKGQVVGTLTLSIGNETLASVPLAVNESISKAGFFTQIQNKVKGWF
ncbi:D-alanyl-D-alanine carboxypeptidase [Francisellaceae bacterium]|nr:D-alanyl-D-alanine carboxypeptidase [Francisellaceae bacterium]